jgi:hypothetical protein
MQSQESSQQLACGYETPMIGPEGTENHNKFPSSKFYGRKLNLLKNVINL